MVLELVPGVVGEELVSNVRSLLSISENSPSCSFREDYRYCSCDVDYIL